MAMTIGGVDKAQNLTIGALAQFAHDAKIRSVNLVYDRISHGVEKVDSVIGTVRKNLINRYGDNHIYQEFSIT